MASCSQTISCFTITPCSGKWGEVSWSSTFICVLEVLTLVKVKYGSFRRLAKTSDFVEGGMYLAGWGRLSRFEKRLRKEATQDIIKAVIVSRQPESRLQWDRKFSQTVVSIALHIYNQEVSGRFVKVVTATTRTIAKVMVIMTSEKIPTKINFLRIFIWTPQSKAIGIDITRHHCQRRRWGVKQFANSKYPSKHPKRN